MTFDQQYKTKQGIRLWPNEELTRFLGKTYGTPWPSHHVARGLRAGEIGCGAGANLRAFFYWGFAFMAIDASQEAMTLAWEVLEEEHPGMAEACAMQCATVPPLPWPPQFLDLIIDIQTIQHLSWDDHVKTYAEVYRVLKPCGRFFSQHLCTADPGVYPDHPELAEHTSVEALVDAMTECGLQATPVSFLERLDCRTGLYVTWHSIEAVKP